MSGLTVPQGDPAALRAAAAELGRTAGLVRGTGHLVAAEGSSVVSSAGWTGTAAQAFTGRSQRLASSVSAQQPPLDAMAAALRTYADALQAAQTRARAAVALAADAHHLGPEDMPDVLEGARQDADAAHAAAAAAAASCARAVAAATAELPDRREAPPEVREAEAVEKEAPSLTELADRLNVEIGYLLSPVAAALSVREGQVWVQSARAWAAGSEAARAALFGEVVSPMGLAYDRGEVSWAQLVGAVRRYEAGADAIAAFENKVDLSEFADLHTGGVPETGWMGYAVRGFTVLGMASDVLTLVNPGVNDSREAAVNRGAAALNLAGSAAVLAPQATTAVVGATATALGIDAAVGWVPVAGQVVVAATGLYLAGDWAYHNFEWFHDGVDGTAHAVGSAVTTSIDAVGNAAAATGQAVSTASSAAASAVSDAASSTWHAAETVTHHLNPFHW